jgi:hypothetical protein
MMQIHPCDGFSSPNHIKLHQIDVFYCCCMHSRRVAWISSQHQLPNDILHVCVFKKNSKFSGTYKKVRPNKVSRVWFGNLSKAAVLLGMVECPPAQHQLQCKFSHHKECKYLYIFMSLTNWSVLSSLQIIHYKEKEWYLAGCGTKGIYSSLTSSGILANLLVSMFIITQVLQGYGDPTTWISYLDYIKPCWKEFVDS